MGKLEKTYIHPLEDEEFVEAMSNSWHLREILLIDDTEEDLFARRDQDYEIILKKLSKGGEIPIPHLAHTALLKFDPILKKYESNPEMFDWGDDLHSSAQGFVEYLKRMALNAEPGQPGSQKVEGFDTDLTDDQVSCLYEKMNNTYFIGDPDSFRAIFRRETCMDNFKKVKWILPNKNGRPHKTTLREFFKLQGIIPTQRIISGLITDKNGEEIVLLKQKKGEYSSNFSKLQDMLISCKIPTFEI